MKTTTNNETTEKKVDILDLQTELESIAALAYVIASPMIDGENTLSAELLGSAIHGLATYIDRINKDLSIL